MMDYGVGVNGPAKFVPQELRQLGKRPDPPQSFAVAAGHASYSMSNATKPACSK